MFERVAILGVGLIGGSIAAGLKRRGLAKEIIGYSPFDGEEAFRLGLLHGLAAHAEQAVQGAELVIVGVPPGLVAEVIAQALPALAPDAVVTDVSSVKGPVLRAVASAMGARFSQFVSSHPIAGAEHSGPAAANPDLFERARVVLNPCENAMALARVTALWAGLGANVSLMEVDRHDAVYAAVSHLPHVVAFALCLALARRGDAQELAEHGGAGLRDTSRVGGSSAALWTDILLANRAALGTAAKQHQAAWNELTDALEQGDRERLLGLIEQASAWRRGLK